MGENNFNRRQCARALIKLGFKLSNNRRGNHDKYETSKNFINHSANPFVMIPRHNNLHCQNAIIKELKIIGGDELVDKFRKYL
jgi:hypothetical protein